MTDERYQKIMADLGMPNSRSLLQALQQVANEVAQEVQAAERERCAKICESMHDADLRSDYAWAIRTEWAADSEGPNTQAQRAA